MTDIKMYLVGGAVRDRLLGLPVKDFDYTVVVNPEVVNSIEEAYTFMADHLRDLGFTIFLETPEYLTIRAKFPKGHENAKITADFVLARHEGPYSDGRRPDWVVPGTLEDDLSRRDFSVNAMAEDEDGTIIDLFGGQEDLKLRRLRAVGDPLQRLKEDALRAFRAVRFAITKGFWIDDELAHAMRMVSVHDALSDNISADRIRDELHRCFEFDSVKTITYMVHHFPGYLSIMRDKGIWLEPTMKGRKQK